MCSKLDTGLYPSCPSGTRAATSWPDGALNVRSCLPRGTLSSRMTTRYSGIVGIRRSSAVLKRARDRCFPEACLEGEVATRVWRRLVVPSIVYEVNLNELGSLLQCEAKKIAEQRSFKRLVSKFQEVP